MHFCELKVEGEFKHNYYSKMAHLIRESDYSVPAGIFTDQVTSFQLGKAELQLAKINKEKVSFLRQPSVMKKYKSVAMGHEFVTKLAKANQVPTLRQILRYLTWLELSLLLVCAGPHESYLSLLAVSCVGQIFVENTKKMYHRSLWLCKFCVFLKKFKNT